MHDLAVPLARRREVARGMWVLSFSAPEIAAEVRAGQFVNLALRLGPLLRRPFSVYRTEADSVEILLKEVGTGTRQLLGMRPGDSLRMLGPLGRGFNIAGDMGRVALVSGGLGVAAMPLAAREARALGVTVHWVHGARSHDELCREWDADVVHWATDDGSRGAPGSAVDAVPQGITNVLACGPNPMLRAVADRWPAAQVAVETYMGCGTGVCLGCAVPRSDGAYDRACTEGPVYAANSIRWNEMPARLHYACAI